MSQPAISFRPIQVGDHEALVRIANNPRVSANLHDHFPFPYTTEDAQSWIAANVARDPQTSMAICVGDEFAGGIGLVIGSDIRRKSAEVGYWLGEPYWGRGIATRCLMDFSAWAFQTFDLVRLSAGVFESNPASARVLEKAGFELEGRHRRAVVKRDQVLDELIYAKLRD